MCERGLGAWHREGGLSGRRFCGGGRGRRSGVGFRHVETELSFRQWRENAEELGIGVQSMGMQTEFEV